MNEQDFPQSTLTIARRPIHPMTVAFPMALLVANFALDLAYMWSGDGAFIVVSFWALAFGVLTGALAGTLGLVDFLGNRAIRNLRAAWIHGIGNIVILGLSVINLLLRYDDGAIVLPSVGIIFSTIVFVAIHITGWMGWTMVYRHRVGVTDPSGSARAPR